jgi:hypothetical protein
MVRPAEHCAVKRCLAPVAYVLDGETRFENGQVFTTDALPICGKHRNLLKQADPTLPIKDIEEVEAW